MPERPAESQVKEELAREYKKGGCVVRDVRVVDKKSQSGTMRTAVITFSDPADVSKALEDSRNKRILGSLIDVEKLNSHSDDRWPKLGFNLATLASSLIELCGIIVHGIV